MRSVICVVFSVGLSVAASPASGSPPQSGSPLYSAQSVVTADVSLAFGYADAEGGSGLDGTFVAGTGVVAFPLTPAWHAAFEIAELIDGQRTDYGGFAHLHARGAGAAAGFFAGASKSNGSANGTAITAGAGVAVFRPDHAVIAVLAHSWGSGGVPDSWAGAVEGRWYPTADTRFSGQIAYRTGEAEGLRITAGAEHRFQASRFTLFGALSYATGTGSGWRAVAGTRLLLDFPPRDLRTHDEYVPFAAGPLLSR